MPGRQTHALVGLLPFLAVFIVGIKVVGNSTFLTSGLLFLLGNLIPDILEPARHFTHRKFLHSQKVLKILAVATIVSAFLWVALRSILQSQIFLFITVFLAGYVIHLLMDSKTKMGLPGEGDSALKPHFKQRRGRE